MKKSVKLTWSNLKVGALVLIVVSVTIWASFTGGGTSIFESKQTFTCFFRNVDGLVVGSPVWMAGLEVGNVRSLTLINVDSLAQVEVTCAVKMSAWERITPSAEVLLGSIGFLGDKYIEVIPFPELEDPIPEGGVIRTRDAGDVKAVFREAEEVAKSAGSVVSNFDSLLARMNRGEGSLGKMAVDTTLYANLTELIAKVTLLASDLQKNQVRVVESIERLSGSVSSLADQVSENSGTLSKLINDPQLYDNLASSAARLDTIMSSINSAEGSLGLMVNDTALYTGMADLVARMNGLITDIKENPKKYFKVSVF
jgi:phospholipid/cholesterol/gamma-HCH transport system substrate-binding protein